MKRKVAIFTGNRAEYGLQYPIMLAVRNDPRLDMVLLVSGAHLAEDFGYTVREIERDGLGPWREVPIDMEHDSLFATAQAIGSGVQSVSRLLAEERPDIVVVYADRFEAFAALIASTQMGIPTAHIEGGDLTEGGALDDSVRHAMTKLAHLHFTTNEQSRERVLKMGEEPWRVFNTGFPAIDLIAAGRFASPEELVSRYGIAPDRPLVVFTQHSVATEYEKAAEQVRPSLCALETLAREGVQVLVTYPNNDAGGRRIIAELDKFAKRGIPNVQVRKSLGRHDYHGMLAICGQKGRGACAGNSSSGIKETPAFGCPTVNIGSRQKGRLRAKNVIDVGYDAAQIEAALRKCLWDEEFRALCRSVRNPYGEGDSGRRIADVLATIPLDLRLIQKRMTY